MPKAIRFLWEWRQVASRAYHLQYGLFFALPIVCGCLEAFLISWIAYPLFLALALFLEARPYKRLALQSLVFVIFSFWAANAQTSDRADSSMPTGLITLEGKVSGFPSL